MPLHGRWNPVFVKLLRVAMNSAGFNETQLVCGDDSHAFSCAATAASDPSLRDIIVALGSHGPQVSTASLVSVTPWFVAALCDVPLLFPCREMTQSLSQLACRCGQLRLT